MIISVNRAQCLVLAMLIILSILGELRAGGETKQNGNGWGFGTFLCALTQMDSKVEANVFEVNKLMQEDSKKINNWCKGDTQNNPEIVKKVEENIASTDEYQSYHIVDIKPVELEYTQLVQATSETLQDKSNPVNLVRSIKEKKD